MGYTIIIGEAYLDTSDPEIHRWRAEINEDADAPVFVGDEPTNSTNVRKPMYSIWETFLHNTGLHDLFMNRENGLMRNHPGLEKLTEEHYRQINAAYLLMTTFNDKQPGWQNKPSSWDTARYGNKPSQADDGTLDPDVARLLWLRFWVRWSLDNCENPSIYNG